MFFASNGRKVAKECSVGDCSFKKHICSDNQTLLNCWHQCSNSVVYNYRAVLATVGLNDAWLIQNVIWIFLYTTVGILFLFLLVSSAIIYLVCLPIVFTLIVWHKRAC